MQAVSGEYVSQSFSPETGNYTLSFKASTALKQYPSVVYLNERLHYPNGYTVR